MSGSDDAEASRFTVSGAEPLVGVALRRAIEVRDRTCQEPLGCDVPAEECDVDHIVPYTEGGETTQENGRCTCKSFNRHRDSKRGPPPS